MRRRSQSSAPVPPKDIDANDASNRLVGHFWRANPGQFSRVPKRSGVQSSLILQLIAVSLVRIIPSEWPASSARFVKRGDPSGMEVEASAMQEPVSPA
jgi:hypothetical protein